MLALRFAVQRIEVVPVEDDVDAHVLGTEDRVADLGVVGVLGLELDANSDGVGSHDRVIPHDPARQSGSATQNFRGRESGIGDSSLRRGSLPRGRPCGH